MISYETTGAEVGRLVSKKQIAYGDSFNKSGDILKILYPNGVSIDQYKDMLCIVRIIDKLFRISNSKNAFNENPYMDIVGYGLLGMASREIDSNE